MRRLPARPSTAHATSDSTSTTRSRAVTPARLVTAAAALAVAGGTAAALVGVPLAGASPGATRHAAAPHSARYVATAKRVVRPVDAGGHAVGGRKVHRETKYAIDCAPAEASPGAVDADIEECSPSAAYAIACWQTPTAHRALCVHDGRSRKLYLMRYSGKFAPTAPPKAADRAPLLVVLTDGTRCSIRDGGAWGSLKGHPDLYGTYACNHHGVAWGGQNAPHWGIDESQASWTLRTASFNGRHLVVRHIRRAFFVGTAKG